MVKSINQNDTASNKGEAPVTSYPEPYIHYLIQFHVYRDYFECHEILEEHWKKNPADALSKTWAGLIQVAVALYHQRRGNLSGAQKMLNSAINILREKDLTELGIDSQLFMARIRQRAEELAQHPNPPRFEDLNIPLADHELLQLCLIRVGSDKHAWEHPSDLTNEQLIHKHMLRDRSDVIRLRQSEKLRKAQQRKPKS
jgi:predicted metal-dependent hydrolase